MIYDYIANQIRQSQSSIKNLSDYEEQAKDRSDEQKQKQAKKEAIRNLLPASMAVHPYLEASKLASANEFRAEWQGKNKVVEDCFELVKLDTKSDTKLKEFYKEAFEIPQIQIEKLPPCSFVVQFRFVLAQPYISRDEADFYIIDNPVRKDKIFGLPYVAPTSWKGSLRAALYKMGYQGQDEQIKRLFGNDKDVEKPEDLQEGRLHFFPTFFTKKSLEIINPHDRQRRVGKNPILIESVPIGADGVFSLLYVPFNSQLEKDVPLLTHVANDLELVAAGLKAMLCEYGFGAKTSSGFGLVQPTLSQTILTLRADGVKGQETEEDKPNKPAQPDLPRYLETPERLKSEYRNNDGTFKESSDVELKSLSRADRQLYNKAKNWWEKTGKELAQKAEPEPPAPSVPQKKSWPSWSFTTFDELKTHVQELKAQVQ